MRTRAAARLSEAPRSPLADERRARIATTTSWSSAPIVDELIQDGKRIAEDEQKAQAALRQIQQQLEQQLEAREARVTAYFNRKKIARGFAMLISPLVMRDVRMRGITAMLNVSKRRALNSWLEAAEESRRLRHAAMSMRNVGVKAAWNSWWDFVDAMRESTEKLRSRMSA